MSELIDRQAFIENERKLYCEDCDRRKGTKNGKPNVICYEIGEAPCRACWLDDALTDLEDFPAASPWHRVEEEMPDEVGSYLVYAPTYIGGSSSAKECKAGVMFAKWLKGGHWSIEVGYYKRPGCVTHWMPIEPPKEDA